MMSNRPVFTCSTCGASHEVSARDEGTGASEESLAELKATWDKCLDRLDGDYGDRAKLEAAEVRASIAYLAAARRTNVWQVPETITTVRIKDQWQFRCVICP